jgi:hypothetical protein
LILDSRAQALRFRKRKKQRITPKGTGFCRDKMAGLVLLKTSGYIVGKVCVEIAGRFTKLNICSKGIH